MITEQSYQYPEAETWPAYQGFSSNRNTINKDSSILYDKNLLGKLDLKTTFVAKDK